MSEPGDNPKKPQADEIRARDFLKRWGLPAFVVGAVLIVGWAIVVVARGVSFGSEEFGSAMGPAGALVAALAVAIAAMAFAMQREELRQFRILTREENAQTRKIMDRQEAAMIAQAEAMQALADNQTAQAAESRERQAQSRRTSRRQALNSYVFRLRDTAQQLADIDDAGLQRWGWTWDKVRSMEIQAKVLHSWFSDTAERFANDESFEPDADEYQLNRFNADAFLRRTSHVR